MELDDLNREAVNGTLWIMAQIQLVQDSFAYLIERSMQVASSPVEATLGWNNRKQIAMTMPMAQQVCLQIPASTLAHQSHRQQFTVAAHWLGARTLELGGEFFPDVIYDYVHVQAKIIEIFYHWAVSLVGVCELDFPNPTGRLPIPQIELA